MIRLSEYNKNVGMKSSKTSGFDSLTALIYVTCIIWGIINIFAAIYQPGTPITFANFFDFSLNSTRQIMFLGVSMIFITAIMVIDFRSFEVFSYFIYAFIIFLLVLVLFIGKEISGSRSWFGIGSFGVQPSEFAKFATALALAKYLSGTNIKFERLSTKMISGGIIAIPAFLILLQGDLGSAMVFSSFLFVLYREGLPHWILIAVFSTIALFVLTLLFSKIYIIIGVLTITLTVILFLRIYVTKKVFPIIATLLITFMAIGFVLGIDFALNDILKPYQRERIMVLINPDNDKVRLSAGWNVAQSKIAIGSGGFFGKGFLNGTQTKFDFVPEQSTDFIFCTIGEEYGWLGSLFTISLFLTLLYRVILIAERQRDDFGRVYGYGVASIIFFHFTTNIAMTIGLFPVIGIPLPFFSYGGSSLIAFTILLFILLKIDAHRTQMLKR